MSSIQQTYATHCTYATSAIERRDTGDFRDRVLGYSARASSYAQADLRRHFRTIERFLYYYLPKDTPPDKKQSLTPRAAPHRLFFCPSLSGLQALGYLSYRQTDCAGRVGSYFAHVLTGDANGGQPVWDVIECLQLWNAPGWVLEDSPAFSYELPVLPDLPAVRAGGPRPLDERVLWSFLNTPPGGPFHSPDATLIPQRWRQMPVADRQRYFRLALTGYLEAAAQPRESLLILAEPSIAVLFFYGIARLLPAELRAQLSFSTFETAADRLVTALAALTFDDEQAGGDVPDERYKRGFTLNTWRADRVSPLRYTQCRYADLLLASLVGRADADAAVLGQSIDGILARFQAAGVQQAVDLESAAQAHAVVEQILLPGPRAADESWRKSPLQKAYVQKAIRQQLRGSPDTAFLDRLLKSPTDLPLVFEVALTAGGEDDCSAALNYLVERIDPLDQLDSLLGAGQLARQYKLHALRHFVATRHRLPDHCRWLWTDQPAAPHGSTPLLFELLHSPVATASVLGASLDRVPEQALNRLFRAVLTGPLDPPQKQDVLTRIAGRTAFDIASLMVESKAELAGHAALLKPVLLPRLHKMLEQVPGQPEHFAATMNTFDAAGPIWAGDAAAASIQGWLDLKRALDGYQQTGGDHSVLGLGAKGPARWDFEDQAGACLAHLAGSAPPQASANSCERLTAFVCSLANHYGIGHCLTEESEAYLAAALRQDDAAKRQIREKAEEKKLERTNRRLLHYLAPALAIVMVLLVAVLLWVIWPEIRPPDVAEGPKRDTAPAPQAEPLPAPEAASKDPDTPSPSPAPQQPASASANPQAPPSPATAESPAAPAPASSAPEPEAPTAAPTPQPAAPSELPGTEVTPPAKPKTPAPPQPDPTALPETKAIPEPKSPEPMAEPPAGPPIVEPGQVRVAEGPLQDVLFDPNVPTNMDLRDAVPADIDMRLHGREFFTRIFREHQDKIPVDRLVVKAESASTFDVKVQYKGGKEKDADQVARFFITSNRQLKCRVFPRESMTFLGRLQRNALRYSVLELAPKNSEEDPTWVAFVKPVQHTFTADKTGTAFCSGDTLRGAVPRSSPLYLGAGKVIDASGKVYEFGDSWKHRMPTYRWPIRSLAEELEFEINIVTRAVDESITVALEPIIYSSAAAQAKNRFDGLKRQKDAIQTLLKSVKPTTLKSEQDLKKFTAWHETTAALARELGPTATSAPPVPYNQDDLARWLANPVLNDDEIKKLEEGLENYGKLVTAEANKKIASLQQDIDELGTKHSKQWDEAQSRQERFDRWVAGVTIQATVFRLVPYDAVGDEKQSGAPEYIRVIVIQPNEAIGTSDASLDPKKAAGPFGAIR